MISQRRSYVALSIVVAVLIASLPVFATELWQAHAHARQNIVQRFRERARISAALTQSLFETSYADTRSIDRATYGRPYVSSRPLAAAIRRGHLVYAALLGPDGQMLASAGSAPAQAMRTLSSLSVVRAVAGGAPFEVGDLQHWEGPVIVSAQAIPSIFGRRVLVQASPGATLYSFLGSYLGASATIAGGAYVLDSHNAVIGSPSRGLRPGDHVRAAGLVQALAHRSYGHFGRGGYFVSSSLGGSTWRVVLTIPTARLFSSISGPAEWLPWLLLGAFGIATLLMVGLLCQALVGARRLARANERMTAANEALECSMARLRSSEERFRLLVDGVHDHAIYMLDPAGLVVSWNEGAERIKGYGADVALGSHLSRFYTAEDVRAGRPAAALAIAERDGFHEEEGWRVRQDGTRFWAHAALTAVRNDNGELRGFAKITRDTTERKLIQERLVHDALHDPLTGLPNRTLFADRLAQSLARAERDPSHSCAVLFLDVDHFKLVNDGFNHAVGDELLVAIGRRLSSSLRRGDTAARSGGDEFTILLERVRTAEAATAIAERVERLIEEPLRLSEREVRVTASIGIALAQPGSTTEELVRDADTAMYAAKLQGPGRVAVFDAGMHQRVVHQLHLQNELREVVEGGRLRVFYQPIIDLGSGRITGLEALARWPASETPLSPDEFIPAAEESGLIAPLGEFVLEEACSRLADWRARGLLSSTVSVSVNVSGRQVDDVALPQTIAAALERSGLPASALRLELTETTILREPERVREVLGELARIGVRAQIDDFGTGYSSLSFLHGFPGDALKIARGFVASVNESEASQAIVAGIVALAHNLGLSLVAEGVENEAQARKLRLLGCEYAQGFLFGRPLPPEELEEVLAGWDAAGVAAIGTGPTLARQPSAS